MSGYSITRRDIQEALDFAGRSAEYSRRHAPKGEQVLGAVACQAESGLAALGYGMLQGRFGSIKLGPLHADLAAGLALHGAAVFGLFGRHAGHGHNFAQGLLDGYLSRIGIGIGTQMALKAGAPTTPTPRMAGGGYSPSRQNIIGNAVNASPSSSNIIGARRKGGGPVPLTHAEIAAMAQQVK